MSSSTAPGEVRAGGRRGDVVRVTLAAAALGALQLFEHRVAVAGATMRAGVLAPLLLPGLVLVLTAARHGVRSTVSAVCALLGVAAAALAWPAVAEPLPLLGQLTICLSLAWWFGSSLLPGAQPVVTRIAHAVHGDLPPAIHAYSRRVTAAWAVFLLGLALASLALFAFASREAWSVFANLLLFPLVAGMFLAEYAYRTWRFPWFAHASLAQGITAFQRLRETRTPMGSPPE